MNKLFLAIFTTITTAQTAYAGQYYADSSGVTARVSADMGQLLDWSNTDKKIHAIFIDNPERFRDSFIFVADGCNQKQCTNATALSISAKEGGKYERAVLKVRTIDSKGRYAIVTVKVEKVPYVDDGTIVFGMPPQPLTPVSSSTPLF